MSTKLERIEVAMAILDRRIAVTSIGPDFFELLEKLDKLDNMRIDIEVAEYKKLINF